jgi:hypothetical protein
MGLESHVHRELQRAASGLVMGEDYWFFDGLRCVSLDVAERLKESIDNSGEFGPTTITEVPKTLQSKSMMFGTHLIKFGIYRGK